MFARKKFLFGFIKKYMFWEEGEWYDWIAPPLVFSLDLLGCFFFLYFFPFTT